MGEHGFRKLDLVTKRDGDGTVGFVLSTTPDVHAGERWYRVQFGASQENCRESDLSAHAHVESLVDLLASDRYGGPDSFRRHITAAKLKLQLTDTLYSFGASRTQLYPYQFVPLLKFLASPYRRILVADEVGLGKTIEAGYILQEELARGRLARVLVVCPAGLRFKWQDELLGRFGHRFSILDAAQARQQIPLREGVTAAGSPLRAIVSLQSIRNERFIETIAGTSSPVDLLIVDEAHHCRNLGTLQARAVSALVEQADSVVFLSATPIQTSELNLFSLLHVLIPEEFPSEEGFQQRLRLNQPIVETETLLRQQGAEMLSRARERLASLSTVQDGRAVTDSPLYRDVLRSLDSPEPDSASRRVELQEQVCQLNLLSNVFTRTKRRDVHLSTAQRRSVIPEATLTPEEQRAYDQLSEFIFSRYQRYAGDGAARLVLTTYQRQIASSLPAAIRKFRDACMSAEQAYDPELELSDDEIDSGLDYKPVNDPEFKTLVMSFDVRALERVDTKYSLLLQSLRQQHQLVMTGERTSRKCLVFSYFRRSLDYLARRLAEDGFSFVRIDGSVPSNPQDPNADERGRRIARFRDDPSIDLLLTSEVGSEGLDFQFCDAMVNWDLPWNPMVVEQRIGRLDRIGQRSPTISVVNLACNGTIEARILRRLYERIGIFEHSIGELEPILGDIVRQLESELFHPGLTPSEQVKILHSSELAIQNQRRKQKALEDHAEQLIGHDEYFRSKLDRIRRFGRYVGGEELRLFADNELKSLAPGLAFSPDEDAGVYRLASRPEVVRAVDDAIARTDEEGHRFLDRYRRGTQLFTFDGEVADRHRNAEPLHAQHPLIRALAHRLSDDLASNPQVASVEVASTAVPRGQWFYVWTVVVETGFLAAKSLLCAVIDLRGATPMETDSDAGDQLLADMLRSARSWHDFNPPSALVAADCLRAAEAQIRARVDDLQRKRHSRTEAIKAARRGTVEATYRVRIDRQRARLEDMQMRSAYDTGAQRILPAYKARLEQLEAEREVQLDRIDQVKVGTVTYALLGAGFVNVLSG